MVRVFSWSVRGFNNSIKTRNARKAIQTAMVDMVPLQETKLINNIEQVLDSLWIFLNK